MPSELLGTMMGSLLITRELRMATGLLPFVIGSYLSRIYGAAESSSANSQGRKRDYFVFNTCPIAGWGTRMS